MKGVNDVKSNYWKRRQHAGYNELCEEPGIRPTVSYSGTNFYNASFGTVQLGDNIHVTVTYSTYVSNIIPNHHNTVSFEWQ